MIVDNLVKFGLFGAKESNLDIKIVITYDNADKKEWYNFKMNWTRNFRHDIYKYPKILIKYRTWKVYPSYFPCWTNVTFSNVRNNTNILYIDSKNLSRCIINLELWLCCISRWILFPFSMFFFLSFFSFTR